GAIACHLARLGVRRDIVVAIVLPRTADWVVAALAIWRAGGAYLPIDPAEPFARAGAMLADADARVIVTCASLAKATSPHRLPLLLMDAAETKAVVEPASRSGLDDLAYVVFTSGSTGRPKGALVEHRGLVNLVDWQRRALDLTKETR